jgi:hypothetical protein
MTSSPPTPPTFSTPCASVYTDYDTANPPPHPSPALSDSQTFINPKDRWTRFVCISDTHSHTRLYAQLNLPPGDVLVHAGDLSSWGEPEQVLETLNWLKQLDYPVKM